MKNAKTGPAWVKTELYLGSSIPAGGQITEEQFADFVDRIVTPEFPEGLTMFDAYGQMQESDKLIVKQPTKVIVLVHENNTLNDKAVQQIIDEYRGQFGNPQVMRLSAPTNPQFLGN